MLCNECFTTVHHALGKFSALHRTFPLQTVNKVDEVLKLSLIKNYVILRSPSCLCCIVTAKARVYKTNKGIHGVSDETHLVYNNYVFINHTSS